MKIGLVLDDTLDTPDGVQQYVLHVGRWLSDHGHEVMYLVGETKRKDLPNIHSLSKNVHVRFNGNRMSMPLPTSRRRLRQFLRANPFDVLHVQVPYSPFMAGRLIRLAPPETTIVGTFHVLPYSALERTANRLLAKLNYYTAKRFDAMIAASPGAADFAKTCYGFHVQIIPHPFDYHHFAATRSAKPHNPRLVYMTRLVERKGPQWFLRAIVEMKRRGSLPVDAEVCVGGRGPLAGALQQYVQANGLEKAVHFTGFVPEAEKAAYLAQADVAVFPSTAGESFGISIIEAMAATRGVVLAGDNPGYRAALPVSRQLFDPTNTSAFADLLEYWLQHPAERKEAAKNQRLIARDYDQEIICREILKVYEQALQSRRQS